MQDVLALSDDEPPTVPKVVPGKPSRNPARARGPKLKNAAFKPVSLPLILRRRVEGACGCNESCFQPFRDSRQLFQQLLDLRIFLSKLTKLEQDEEVPLLDIIHDNIFLSMNYLLIVLAR